MRNVVGVLAALAMALGGVVPAGRAAAPSPATLPLSEIHPGMTGYGLTVIHGVTIDRFRVQIMGILRGGGPTSDLILFRAGGAVIDRAGGTAEGMSGSPIYIDGKIIGALSYGYHFPGRDADLSLATPIGEMLKILSPARGAEVPPSRVYDAAAPISTPAGPIARVFLMRSTRDAAGYNRHPLPQTVAVAPTAVPLFVAGVSPMAFTILSRVLGRYNVVPMQGYGGTKVFTPPPIEPGSSMGIELVRGDVEMGAIGTVTYRRGNQVLAFGHPLLNAGPTAIPITAAWINTVVRSIEFPFKEGSIGPLVGLATEDRSNGVGGVIGKFPQMFGVRVRVRNAEAGPVRETDAQVVRRADLAESLVPLVALSAVQRSLDQVSGGSASIRISLRSRGVPGEIVREDLAYDTADIATAAALSVPDATQLLFGNFFKTLDPVDMTIDITVSPRPNTALLVSARPQVRSVTPGQRVRVEIGLWPHGGTHQIDRTMEFTVPPDFPPGPAFLLVGTAGSLNDPTPTQQKFQLLTSLLGSPSGNAASLDEAVSQFEDFGKNTEVLVDLVPTPVLEAVGGNANPSFESTATASLPTEWVVLGRFQIPMVVK
ncbi:MAG TPA: SpoIVB peptidase S55 domain-containing protein [bacterium]|nr:SpoIVB peptidase S55 domain-containing protein [bacterium]